MKRNFVVSLFGSLVGFGMLFILLSAAGIVGARGADIPLQQARPDAVSAATPLTSTFTYQGQLKNGGNAVTGSCDMAFRLYDDPGGGNLIGSPITMTVPIDSGLFTVGLNFGNSAFTGSARWLDIRVRCPAGSGSYTALTPRQAVTAVPYALAPWVTSGSTLYYSSGNVGIGTTTPSSILSVVKSGATEPVVQGVPTGLKVATPSGTIPLALRQNANESGTPGLAYFETNAGDLGYLGAYPSTFVIGAAASHGLGFNVDGSIRAMTVLTNGTVGIGTTTPCASTTLHVSAGNSGFACGTTAAVFGESSGVSAGVYGANSGYFGYGAGVFGQSTSGAGVEGGSSSYYGVYGYSTSGGGVYAGSVSGAALFGVSDSGTGLIGQSNSGTYIFEGRDLGNLRFAVERATGNVKADGSFTSPADFAEMMTVTGLKDDYAPGDVLVIGPDGKLALSDKPNAVNLAGVYSAKPGFLGDTEIAAHGIEYYDSPSTQERIAVALLGIVPVKVTAENGQIQPGDLLTTSSTPGHAMKAKPVVINGVEIYPTGAILGKALEPWKQGPGVIKVLVTLR